MRRLLIAPNHCLGEVTLLQETDRGGRAAMASAINSMLVTSLLRVVAPPPGASRNRLLRLGFPIFAEALDMTLRTMALVEEDGAAVIGVTGAPDLHRLSFVASTAQDTKTKNVRAGRARQAPSRRPPKPAAAAGPDPGCDDNDDDNDDGDGKISLVTRTAPSRRRRNARPPPTTGNDDQDPEFAELPVRRSAATSNRRKNLERPRSSSSSTDPATGSLKSTAATTAGAKSVSKRRRPQHSSAAPVSELAAVPPSRKRACK